MLDTLTTPKCSSSFKRPALVASYTPLCRLVLISVPPRQCLVQQEGVGLAIWIYKAYTNYFIRQPSFYQPPNTDVFPVVASLHPYLEALTLIIDTPARKVARLHSSGILAFGLTGQHQDKRFYVGGIIWPLGFADVIFRVERETTTENTPVFASYLFMCKSTIYDLSSSFRLQLLLITHSHLHFQTLDPNFELRMMRKRRVLKFKIYISLEFMRCVRMTYYA